jgi:dipicolinate synthase subunit A
MLTDKHVVFVGGDARQLEVIKSCIQLDAKVSLIGYDNLRSPFSGATLQELNSDYLRQADILVLPVMGTDEQGMIMSVFTSKEILLTEEHIQSLPKHAIVFVGIASSHLKNMCERHAIRLLALMERDDVAIYNSIPTVEGALMMAIQNTDITIHGSVCIVLGLGRVGMSLARTLHAIGARVRVGVRDSDDMARAFEMGLEPFDISALSIKVMDADIIFNTIPSVVVTAAVMMRIPHDVLIIDLASVPGGVDYAYAKKRGIKAILAPSLPGIVAPKTAGRILVNTMMQLITFAEKEEETIQ